jgi:short-subunit dehydrogenase
MNKTLQVAVSSWKIFLKNPLVEKPEDVANAIWDAVKNHKYEVFVGSAQFLKTAERFFPGLFQWAFQQIFKNKR